MTYPLVTVFIPTKNRVSLLRRSVYSVIGQTYPNIELIVVDDGSVDATWEFLDELKKLKFDGIKIEVIRNEKSLGACASRNKAILKASGKFVTGLDDDDWFRPDRIELMFNKWKKYRKLYESPIIFDDMIYVYSGRNPKRFFKKKEVRYKDMVCANAIGGQVFCDKKIYVECGMFDEKFPALQDWDLWLRILKKYKVAINLLEATYFVDVGHSYNRITTQKSNKIRKAFSMLIEKHNLHDYKHKLLAMYAHYPESILSIKEILILLRYAKIQTVFEYLKKCLLRA